MVLGVPIFEHIIIRLFCAQILGHLRIINFTFRTNENFIIFGCPNTYRKNSKIWDTSNNCHNCPKNRKV